MTLDDIFPDILWKKLSKYLSTLPLGSENMYYYQYEYDSNLSMYEEMLDKHCIVIYCGSDDEAIILNYILRTFITANCFALLFYGIDSDKLCSLRTKKLVKLIIDEGQSSMTTYKDFKSDKIKEMRGNKVKISYGISENSSHESAVFKKYQEIIFKKPLVFTRDIVLSLLNDVQIIELIHENGDDIDHNMSILEDVFSKCCV